MIKAGNKRAGNKPACTKTVVKLIQINLLPQRSAIVHEGNCRFSLSLVETVPSIAVRER